VAGGGAFTGGAPEVAIGGGPETEGGPSGEGGGIELVFIGWTELKLNVDGRESPDGRGRFAEGGAIPITLL